MQTKSFLQTVYRAAAVGCMLYALTLLADTARASALSVPTAKTAGTLALPRSATDAVGASVPPKPATGLECHLSPLDSSP